MAKPPRLLIAGGGSLGSIYPGLSIARRLIEQMPGVSITIAGDGRAIERHTVRAAGLQYAAVPRADRPSGLLEVAGYAVRNAAGWCVSHWLLREQEIDLVISIGGHASGPMVRAARSSGIPYVLVEQNSLPNPSTFDAAADAHLICLAHEETAARLPVEAPVLCTGGVGRPGFEDTFANRSAWLAPRPEDEDRPRLVVLGGVGTATSLNESMPLASRQLGEALRGWQVVHQTGDGWLSKTEQRYRENGIDAIAVTYIDELAHLARQSDLIVCRSSGSMLAELALAGLPAVLVPDARRNADLQEANARHANLVAGCPIVDETGGDLATGLAEGLRPLLVDPMSRRRIATRLTESARPAASAAIAESCCDLLGFYAKPAIQRAA